MRRVALSAALVLYVSLFTFAQQPTLDTQRGDEQITRYFQQQVTRLRDQCLADATSLEHWNAQRATYRRQLLEMLGLDPLPEKTDLQATITRTTHHDEFTVECLHFQSRPNL